MLNWEKEDMAITVNLDAMIPREDFEAESGAAADESRSHHELFILTLMADARLPLYRKPDFQRETSAWSPRIICNFVKSVVDGDVIPALILWRSPLTGKMFVIDGAHRLSAVIAWIEDDYGDREASEHFFGRQIDIAQKEAAQATRYLVDKEILPFATLRSFARSPHLAPDDIARKRSLNILSQPMYIQMIRGDAGTAEASYLRINSTAVAIDSTEKLLINSRYTPVGITARAILRAGSGYPYWSKFPEPIKTQITEAGKDIYNQLIKPIVEYPIVAVDLPVPERGYSANSAKTIYDLVHGISKKPARKSKSVDDLGLNLDAKDTIELLKRTKAVTERVFGHTHSGSLALHPGVYCYGSTGLFIPKAFIGTILFVAQLEERDKFFQFTEHRKAFEQYLIDNRHFMNQIGTTQGSGGYRGIPAVVALYSCIFSNLVKGQSPDGITAAISSDAALKFLHEPIDEGEPDGGKRFRDEAVRTVQFRESLANENTCPECKARLYRKDRSKDHIDGLKYGGKSTSYNLQFTHPYCNSGYKERKLHADRVAI
jgi:hypothetical protein